MRIRLRRRRRVARKRGAQVAKARRRDDAEARAEILCRNEKALIIAAARAMDDEDGRTAAHIRIFDDASAGLGDAAAGADTMPDSRHVAAIGDVKRRAGDKRDAGTKSKQAFQCGYWHRVRTKRQRPLEGESVASR